MKTLLLLFCPLIFFSCEKNIDFTLHQAPDLLVVDASIENGQPPLVILSKSFDYFSKISPALLAGTFVHDADVYVSNGTKTQKLKEYSIDSSGGNTIFYYSVDSSMSTNSFLGQLNTKYDLKVVIGNQEYHASTTIPQLSKKIDSLWWEPAPFATDSSKVVVIVRATDPPGLGNYIRYYTKQNNGPFLPGLQSVFDDQLIDGTTYDLRLDPGINRNDPAPFDDNSFRHGDTVVLKLSNIDRTTYYFWLTMEFAYQSIGNPFASPNKVLGNVDNGALGSFCGYASDFKTLFIPQ
ncbi:MAG: DUF4249 domain-containing protein [Bacteroidota bacterium]|nr:DUF4249 domain-containing protein [Bacteroidota bacterium]